ncbi:hypothetical protein [Rhodococcus sp. NPDC127528]|uniref:hypothetical protein n=1 Tax=unclassified Rhodococcus (in: high G+C Gram-positive bacteria) TaxID=192944 RepID=UPI00363CB9AF
MSNSRIARAAATAAAGIALTAAAGPSAVAAPAATPPATTTFQVPLVYLSDCFFLFMCGVPLTVTVTPTATAAGASGTVTFDVRQESLLNDCADTWIHWRNLATGATGTTRVPAASHYLGAGRSSCVSAATEVTTGSGPVVATVTAPPGGDPPLVTVNPGSGAFLVR